jgi:alpha-mannosidase
MTKLADSLQNSSSRIQAKVDALRSRSVADVMGCWRFEAGLGDGQRADLNEKRQIVWSKGRQSVELVQQVTLADWADLDLTGAKASGEVTVRLGLTWWAQKAEVWVAGVLVQEGDLFDHTCRVVLPVVTTTNPVEVRLKLVSPGHDIGALMRSRLIVEAADGGIDAGFVADEIEIVSKFVTAFYPEELELLADRLDIPKPPELGVGGGSPEMYLKSIESVLYHWSDRIKQYKIQCLGHAHLDLAWLWTVDETWEAAERTFVSALNLMKDFPQLIFGHTTPVLYEWFEQNRPEIFAQIQSRIKSGQWEAIGGLWVEPEMNLIGGESIARQILYGQRYYDQKFGKMSRVAWLPDTFGFCGQLPQFFKLGGIDYFVTQKLRWNDTTKYPQEVFNWIAPDGSTVLALMSAPIGEWVDPIKMSDYCWEFATRSGLQNCLYLPGVGDHGGGPTRDMLEIAKRWEKSAVFPTIEFTTAERYLSEIPLAPYPSGSLTPKGRGDRSVEKIYDDSSDLPQLKVPLPKGDLGGSSGEIYLEFHRGCYTTHADQKAYNRDGENALYEAELWASIAALTVGFNYPKSELEKTWKKVLFNQFHDILPGTSIREVYPKANRFWDRVLIDTDCIINNAKERIISMIALPEAPDPEARLIVVFNPNNWKRSQFVSFLIPAIPTQSLSPHWQVQTVEGALIESHSIFKQAGESLACIVSAIVPEVPALGYACYWAVPSIAQPEIGPIEDLEIYQIENEYLKVEISGKTGNITSLFDKQNQREVLRGDGNELQSFTDEGQYWDAWNINPKYQEFPLPAAKLFDIHYVHSNPLRSRIEVTRMIGRSTFTQTYSLTQHSPILEIKHYIDWQEKHVLVKTAFPLNLEADFVTYESACGIADRTTRPTTEAERAMWEVPGLRWASLSDGDYGVSILSDRKHGYDHTPNSIRISLLRGPEFPDPIADEGIHEFTLGIYPHAGDWKTADTPKRAIELSLPLQAIVPNERLMQGLLPTAMSLVNLQAEHFMLMAIKRSESNGKQYILRGYEYYGEATEIAIENSGIVQMLQLGDRLDLLENPIDEQSHEIKAWTIASFKLTH